jgi:DNA-binding transcriptional regulator/RsmH inhibitor MraZ
MDARPISIMGKMEQVNVKVDSKGRICIPPEIREEIGDTVTIKKPARISPATRKTKRLSRRIQEINNFRATQNWQT